MNTPRLSQEQIVVIFRDFASVAMVQRMYEQYETHDGDKNIDSELDWLALIGEEFGELAERVNWLRWKDDADDDPELLLGLQSELLDVMALCAWAYAWSINGNKSVAALMERVGTHAS